MYRLILASLVMFALGVLAAHLVTDGKYRVFTDSAVRSCWLRVDDQVAVRRPILPATVRSDGQTTLLALFLENRYGAAVRTYVVCEDGDIRVIEAPSPAARLIG